MNISGLSKCKYIYKIYRSYRDHTFHIERYPIIYANSSYVYFKVANKQELQYVEFRYIKNNISDLDLTKESQLERGLYTWRDPKVTDSELDQIAKEFRRKQYESLIENKKSEIKRLELRLRNALYGLQQLESEKENV